MRDSAARHISVERVKECKASAKFWTESLGSYAAKMDRRSDTYAIISVILSSLTGLAVWSTLAASTEVYAVAIVSAVAFTSAVVAAIPTIRGYSDCAKASRSLSTDYGDIYGDLCDALEALSSDKPSVHHEAQQTVALFEQIRERKQMLKPFPAKLQALRNAQS